jgi:hypothetical protein
MKKLVTLLLFVFASIAANAGPLLEEFKLDIAIYLAAQEKTPNNIIKYSDESGALAKAVLNPARIQNLIAEILAESDAAKGFKLLTDIYKPVATNYENAFKQQKGGYDGEYLDAFEVMFHLLKGSLSTLKKLKIEDVKDESTRTMVEAGVKFLRLIPTVVLNALEKNIQNDLFSASYVPVAKARLTKLQSEVVK